MDDDLWILDWWAGQTSADIWIDETLRLGILHKVMAWVAEGGMIRRAIEPFLKRQMIKLGKYLRMEWINSNKNKSANARSFQALASQGKVHIPNTPWGEELINQLLKFPTGKYDDKVDVCGLFGRILDTAFSPRVMGDIEDKAVRDDYAEDEDEESWR